MECLHPTSMIPPWSGRIPKRLFKWRSNHLRGTHLWVNQNDVHWSHIQRAKVTGHTGTRTIQPREDGTRVTGWVGCPECTKIGLPGPTELPQWTWVCGQSEPRTRSIQSKGIIWQSSGSRCKSNWCRTPKVPGISCSNTKRRRGSVWSPSTPTLGRMSLNQLSMRRLGGWWSRVRVATTSPLVVGVRRHDSRTRARNPRVNCTCRDPDNTHYWLIGQARLMALGVSSPRTGWRASPRASKDQYIIDLVLFRMR